MAAAAILNCCLVTLDHPRSLLHGAKFVLKFCFNHIITFRDMPFKNFAHLSILAPNICILGILTPNIILINIIHRENPSNRFYSASA